MIINRNPHGVAHSALVGFGTVPSKNFIICCPTKAHLKLEHDIDIHLK